MFKYWDLRNFDTKKKLLLSIGIVSSSIKPFDKSVYDRLNKFYFDGLPLSMHVKYGVLKMFAGRCDIRAKYLYFGVDNAKLVSGFRKDLEYKMGDHDASWHYWVEDDNWVYDPTTLHMYKKDLYYKAHGVSGVAYFSEEALGTEPYIKQITETSIEDCYPDGKRRYELLQTVPFMEYFAELDMALKEELAEYLKEISYDEELLVRDLNDSISGKKVSLRNAFYS